MVVDPGEVASGTGGELTGGLTLTRAPVTPKPEVLACFLNAEQVFQDGACPR